MDSKEFSFLMSAVPIVRDYSSAILRVELSRNSGRIRFVFTDYSLGSEMCKRFQCHSECKLNFYCGHIFVDLYIDFDLCGMYCCCLLISQLKDYL